MYAKIGNDEVRPRLNRSGTRARAWSIDVGWMGMDGVRVVCDAAATSKKFFFFSVLLFFRSDHGFERIVESHSEGVVVEWIACRECRRSSVCGPMKP